MLAERLRLSLSCSSHRLFQAQQIGRQPLDGAGRPT